MWGSCRAESRTVNPDTPHLSSPDSAAATRPTKVRRLWTRGRAAWYIIVSAAVARLIWTLLRDASLDPMAGALRPGTCHVVSVADDGTLAVVQPLSAESVDLSHSTSVRRVRLLGVVLSDHASPSAWQSDVDLRPAHWLREAAQGQEAQLEFDRRRFDDTGCWLAYVYVRDQLLNVEFIRAGWGRCDNVPGDSAAKLRELRRAESEARRAGRGAWGGGARELVPVGPPG